MIEILYFIPILLAAFGLGSLTLSRFKFTSLAEKFVFSVAVGLFFFSSFTMILGFLGLLYKSIFLLFFLISLVSSSKNIITFIADIYRFVIRVRVKFSFYSILLFFLVLLILMNLIATMVPVWEIDSILVHFTLPNIYIMNHRIVYTPSHINSFWPLFMEMLYLTGIILKNNVLGKLFAWLSGFLIVLGVYSFCKRFLTKEAGIVAGIVFSTTPLIMEFVTTGMVDVSLGFFTFMAFYAFLIWFNSEKTRWLVLSGIFAGVSASIKINGSFPMAIIALGIFYKFLIQQKQSWYNLRKSILNALLFTSVMYLVVSPWYIRNYVWTGNPFIPFFYNVFGGKFYSKALGAKWTTAISSSGFQKASFFSFLMLPFYMTFFTGKFGELLGIGPFYLSFLPLFFFLWKKRKRATNFCFFFSFVSTIVWFLYSRQIRYLQFAFIYWAIIVGYLLYFLIDSRWKKIIRLLVVSYLLFSVVIWIGVNAKQVPRGLGIESNIDFLNRIRTDHDYEAFEFINQDLPEDAVILFYKKKSGCYSKRKFILGDAGQGYIYFDELKTKESVFDRLAELNVTHIMVNLKMHDKEGPTPLVYSEHTEQIMDSIINDNSILLYEKDRTYIYQLNYN